MTLLPRDRSDWLKIQRTREIFENGGISDLKCAAREAGCRMTGTAEKKTVAPVQGED